MVYQKRYMARRRRKVFRVAGWILAVFLTLIILITAAFFIWREWILKKVVEGINQRQPGEVKVAQINLIPLMDFPDVVLQLRNVSYFEAKEKFLADTVEPILRFDEIYVSLDIVDLIRKSLEVSHIRLKDGWVNYEVYGDSVSNFERALGIRFGQSDQPETDTAGLSMGVDLEEIELSNILAVYRSAVSGDSARIQINGVKSRFRYMDDRIESAIKLNIDINSIKYQQISLVNKPDVSFDSDVLIEPLAKKIEIRPSVLGIAGLNLETSGAYSYESEPRIDLEFRSVNTGLEVLNFLLLGVLDLDEIRQIGSGSIALNGTVSGPVKGQAPLIIVNGSVDRIGFRIKSIERDITGISFSVLASNGTKTDLSEGFIDISGFKARSPEGSVTGNFRVRNMVTPEVKIDLKGHINLEGVGRILKSDILRDLEGNMDVTADVAGVLDRSNDKFLENGGNVQVDARDVGFVVGSDTISGMNGHLYLDRNLLGTRDLSVAFNGNEAKLEVELENLVQYMFGYDKDVRATVVLKSDMLSPATLLKDSTLSGLLGEELKGLHFRAVAEVKKEELDHYLKTDSLPRVDLTLEQFGIELPYYQNISRMDASLTYGPDTISLHDLKGTVGESAFRFSGRVVNYSSLSGNDSTAVIGLDFRMSSDLMRAEDFFSYKDGFLLPETYRTEYLEGFRIAGSLELPVYGLTHDSVDIDFGLHLQDLAWKFRYYPLAFRNFRASIRKKGNELYLDELRGTVGESNLQLSALLGNYADTALGNIYGHMELEADLLDFNELLNYRLPEEVKVKQKADTTKVRQVPRLDQMDYPGFAFSVDIGELRFGTNKIFGMKGKIRSTPEKIFHLDSLYVSGESGGYILVDGQFNVASPWYYNFSARVRMEDVNVNDLDFEMQSEDGTYTLKENFTGLVTADGMAEVFITPDLKLDIPTTTAMFNVVITDGSLINFTPLKSVGKVLDNRNLNNVKFSTLRNRFTLIDSKVIIPRMIVESTIGQLLIEGEQGLDDTQLYLLRIPMWLVKDAIISKLIRAEDAGDEDEIYKMRTGTFMRLTTYSDGEETKVRLGDKRDKYR